VTPGRRWSGRYRKAVGTASEPADHRSLQELVDTCVHCGFCLPTCPTYDLWGQEMDSPRGRIQLMKPGLAGEPLTATTVTHLDRCLGCMACVTSCPSGVRYDRLITEVRAEVEASYPRTLRERALLATIFGLFPYPRRLRVLRAPLRIAQVLRLDLLAARSRLLARLAPALATMAALIPRPRPPSRGRAGGRPGGRPGGRAAPRRQLPRQVPARGQRRAVVGMLTGCVQREMFPQVNAATARVLAAEGCDVVIPRGQGCCGALSLHSGRHDEAVRFASRTAAVFTRAGVDAVVVNAAGCGSAMKEYAALGVDAPPVRDLSEWLVELGPVAPRHPVPVVAAYHDACHLAHAQGIRDQPRRLLAAIPDLDVREVADGDICCGSAGIYNLRQPRAAAELGERKAANVIATGAAAVVSANPGCAMQIGAALRRAGRPLPVLHIAEVLDASIAADAAGASGTSGSAGSGAVPAGWAVAWQLSRGQ
jgi:glycolate oxidase iron-sulfur subunit